MSENIKKYANVATLQAFRENLINLFASKDDLKNKADFTHTHTDIENNVNDLQATLDTKAQVQIITWEDGEEVSV